MLIAYEKASDKRPELSNNFNCLILRFMSSGLTDISAEKYT